MKIIEIGVINGTKYEPHAVITVVERCVNEILKKADGKLAEIEIATSVHQQDKDGLTIRVIGWG